MKLPFRTLTKVMAGLAITILMVSCGDKSKDDDPGETLETRCENLVEVWVSAAEAFTSNPSSQTCEAYKQALLNYVNGCADYVYYDESIEMLIQEMDCSVYDDI